MDVSSVLFGSPPPYTLALLITVVAVAAGLMDVVSVRAVVPPAGMLFAVKQLAVSLGSETVEMAHVQPVGV